MTKQKQNRHTKTFPVGHPQRLIVLIASACTGVIALYFSILTIGNFLSFFSYVIFFCCLMAPFITTRHISKWYTAITVIAAVAALNTLIAESWWTIISNFIAHFCVFYLLATVSQAIYHRKAVSFKLIPRGFLEVKFTSIITICLAISIFLLSPQHFSFTALLAVLFVMYVRSKATSKKTYQTLRILVMWLLFAFLIYAIKSYVANLSYGCASFFGVHVACFSSKDLTYVFAEIAGSLLVLSALLGITFPDYKNPEKYPSKHK